MRRTGTMKKARMSGLAGWQARASIGGVVLLFLLDELDLVAGHTPKWRRWTFKKHNEIKEGCCRVYVHFTSLQIDA